ncbi:MAG: ATP-binding cassette domain-containing protein [Planctomycetia bacterium]|nr:ATP-binding cassette domain-containing protein [Planctomycetia bacterium]
MSSDTPLLEARGIGRRHRDGSAWLVHDISIEISAGDRIAVTGPTGSGKTVALRALAMLDAVDEGTLLWQGKSPGPDQVPVYRSRSIYLSQRARLFDGTVERNLQLIYSLAIHRHRAYSRESIITHLHRLGRDDRFLALDAASLSGGETQIVALLRAIQLEPTILLLDEPTASLDEGTTLQIEQLVADWMAMPDARRAFMWVTHDRVQARRVANRRLQFREGTLNGEGEGTVET